MFVCLNRMNAAASHSNKQIIQQNSLLPLVQDNRDPFPDLPTDVNIGGELYNFNRSRRLPINLYLRTYEEFLVNFNLKNQPRAKQEEYEQLVRAYLPYGVTLDIVNFADMSEDDRTDLIKLLEARIAKLKEAVKMKRNTGQFYVRNFKDEVAIEDIRKTLVFFQKLRDAPRAAPFSPKNIPEIPGHKVIKIPTSIEAAEIKKRLAGMTEDAKTEQILRMAFYTLHPDKLDKTILTEWETIQNWARNAGPRDFIREIRQAALDVQAKAKLEGAEVPESPPPKPLDWLSRMNYAKLQAASNQQAAKNAVKSSLIRLESEEEKQRTLAINSLRRILMVLEQKRYISSQNQAAAAASGDVSLELETKLKNSLQTKLYIQLKPLFDTYAALYNDYYTILVEFLRPKAQTELNQPGGFLDQFLVLHNFLEDVQTRGGENNYPIQPGGLYRLVTPPFPQNFRAFLTELFETLANAPSLPVKEMDPKLYYGLATKDLIGWMEQNIPRQTVMDRKTMRDFLDLDQETPQNPVYLFPAVGGTGPTTILYDVTYDHIPPETNQKLVVAAVFRDLFSPKREKMITVEAARLIVLAMYQVILEKQ